MITRRKKNTTAQVEGTVRLPAFRGQAPTSDAVAALGKFGKSGKVPGCRKTQLSDSGGIWSLVSGSGRQAELLSELLLEVEDADCRIVGS